MWTADDMAGREAPPIGVPEVVGRVGQVELGEDVVGGGGDERPEQGGQDPTGFGQVVQDGIESLGLRGVFGQFEGSGLIDKLVGPIDDCPDGAERVLELMLAELFDGGLDGLMDLAGQIVGDGRDDTVTVSLEHGKGTLDEIAEAVGEFGVVPGLEPGVGPVAVGADIEFPNDIVAEGIDAPFIDDGDRIDDVAGRFAHALAVFLPPAMREDLARERESHRLEHDRPENGVEFDDVLADHMDVGGPQFKSVRFGCPAKG